MLPGIASTPESKARPVRTELKATGFVLLTGASGALVGSAYLHVMRWLERFLGPESHSAPVQLVLMVGIGLAVALLTRVLGETGDVDLLVDNIHVLGGSEQRRQIRSLIPVSLLCIASGGAAGPEAPLVQTTGTLGTVLAERLGLQAVDRRVLTIVGMAAGFTVLFGAPLGAAIFALEILHRRGLEYYEALLPAVAGSLCGYAAYLLTSGTGIDPVWHFAPGAVPNIGQLGWAVAAGCAGAGVAALFTVLTQFFRANFERLPPVARPVLGGLLLGALASITPYALTFGEGQIGKLLTERPLWSLFALAVGAKLVATSLTVSSGWRGGFIIPLFFMGAALGRLWHLAVPQAEETVMMAALMAAANTGVTKTPLGSTLVVTAMAGLHLLPTTLLAAVVALLLTGGVQLIASQRPRMETIDVIDALSPRAAPTSPGGRRGGPGRASHE
jgi:H+/Cl- antiporter ClcA